MSPTHLIYSEDKIITVLLFSLMSFVFHSQYNAWIKCPLWKQNEMIDFVPKILSQIFAHPRTFLVFVFVHLPFPKLCLKRRNGFDAANAQIPRGILHDHLAQLSNMTMSWVTPIRSKKNSSQIGSCSQLGSQLKHLGNQHPSNLSPFISLVMDLGWYAVQQGLGWSRYPNDVEQDWQRKGQDGARDTCVSSTSCHTQVYV